jgi:hypothetical protein
MKPKEGLALDATKAYAELVNVTASQCGGQRKLVAPGSPSSSYLLQKLLNVDVCTGTQMPKAGQSLPQKQIDAISSWICSGAPNNWAHPPEGAPGSCRTLPTTAACC